MEKVRGLFGNSLDSYEDKESNILAPTFFKDILFLKEIKGEEKSNPLIDYVKHHYPSSLFAMYDKSCEVYAKSTSFSLNRNNVKITRSNDASISHKIWDDKQLWSLELRNGPESSTYLALLNLAISNDHAVHPTNLPPCTNGIIILDCLGIRQTSNVEILGKLYSNKINFILPERDKDLLLLTKWFLENPQVLHMNHINPNGPWPEKTF